MNNERKTCQICGRQILAKNGKIAHHGYRRPGVGWQTGSCEGARCLPLEVSDLILERHIIGVRNGCESLKAHIKAPITEIEFQCSKPTETSRTVPGRRDRFERDSHFDVATEANFESVKRNYHFAGSPYSWEEAVARERHERTVAWKRLDDYRRFQQDRYDNNPFKKDYV